MKRRRHQHSQWLPHGRERFFRAVWHDESRDLSIALMSSGLAGSIAIGLKKGLEWCLLFLGATFLVFVLLRFSGLIIAHYRRPWKATHKRSTTKRTQNKKRRNQKTR